MTKPDAIEQLRAALRPLAAIADAWAANELDEDRPEWRANGVGGSPPFAEVELYSGRGGRRLLTLADAFVARGALAAEPPDQGADSPRAVSLDAAAAIARDFAPSPEYDDPCNCQRPNSWHERGSYVCLNEPRSVEKVDAPIASPISGARDLARDLDYLSQADAHADEGPLGEAAARSILAIALHWIRKVYETPVAPAPEKRWPFVESPAAFATRLFDIYDADNRGRIGMLAAVRTVLIEEPPTLAPHVRSAAIAEMAEGLERISARAAKLEAVYAALRTWPIFADGKEIDPEIVAREGLDKAAAEEALAALDAALRAFPELSDPDEPVEPDDVRRVATRHAAMIREGLAVPERPIIANQTDAVTTALLGIGKAWSAFREGSVLGDSIGWGATREAAEADLRAKEEAS